MKCMRSSIESKSINQSQSLEPQSTQGTTGKSPQQRLHYAVHVGQRGIQSGCVFASGFGQVGTASTFAAYFFGYFADDFSGLYAAGEVFGDARNQRDVAICRRTDHDYPRAKFVAELVDHVCRAWRGRFHSGLVEFARQALDLGVPAVNLGAQSFGRRLGFFARQTRDYAFELMILAKMSQRAFAGDG